MSDSVQRSKQDGLLLVGLFCFFFSGAAGLIYQVVWTRMNNSAAATSGVSIEVLRRCSEAA